MDQELERKIKQKWSNPLKISYHFDSCSLECSISNNITNSSFRILTSPDLMWWTRKVTAVLNSDQMGMSLSAVPPNGTTRGEKLNLHQSASGCSAVWAHAPVCAVLSGPAHNGVPLFHLGCFIRPREGNGSTSSAHMASHSCSVSFNLSHRGWAWGTGQSLLCMLLTGNSGVLSALQGPHVQRKTANNLPSYLKCNKGASGSIASHTFIITVCSKKIHCDLCSDVSFMCCYGDILLIMVVQ